MDSGLNVFVVECVNSWDVILSAGRGPFDGSLRKRETRVSGKCLFSGGSL